VLFTQALYNGTVLSTLSSPFVALPSTFSALQETDSISGIQDAIYKVLSTQALYNGTELVTSRRLVRSVIHEVALSNGLLAADANNSSSSSGQLSGLNETDVKILLDIVATVSLDKDLLMLMISAS
jgi:hypothetical protein